MHTIPQNTVWINVKRNITTSYESKYIAYHENNIAKACVCASCEPVPARACSAATGRETGSQLLKPVMSVSLL